MNGNGSTMSRKAAVVAIAIPAIASAGNWQTQAAIAAVAVVGIVAQAVLDWSKKDSQK